MIVASKVAFSGLYSAHKRNRHPEHRSPWADRLNPVANRPSAALRTFVRGKAGWPPAGARAGGPPGGPLSLTHYVGVSEHIHRNGAFRVR